MYIYTYTCICICMYISTYMYTYICILTYIYMYIHMQMYFDTDSHIHVNIYTKVVAVGRQQPSKDETSTCQSYCKVMQYSLSSSLSLWLPLSTYINWNVLSQITLLDSHLLSLSHYFFCTVCRLSVDMRESMRVCVCACVFVCLCVFVRVCMRVCVALSLRLP